VDIGAMLRNEREAQGLTLADLSLRTGIAEPNLSRVERSLSDTRLSTVERIADALHLEITLRARTRSRQTLDETKRLAAVAQRQITRAGLGYSNPRRRIERRANRGVAVDVELTALNNRRRRTE
jgi:transcriptional regulator with XRE-family HTH domain